MSARVAVVILNWNGYRDTVACLDSVMSLHCQPRVTVVVDNGSTDDSVDVVCRWAEQQQRLGEPIRVQPGTRELELGNRPVGATPEPSFAVLCSEQNRGFARGNNLGIDLVLRNFPEVTHLLILNNDTLLQPDCVGHMLDQFGCKGVGLVGPRLIDYQDGSEWQWPVKEPLNFPTMLVVFSVLNRLLRRTRLYRSRFCTDGRAADVYAVPGSCMLFSRRALEEIRGFDPATFLYWEEFIVAEKLRQHGYKTRYAPRAIVAHKLGASTSKLGSQRFVENVRSEAYFLHHYSQLKSWQIAIIQALKVVGYTIRSFGSSDYRANIAMMFRALGGHGRSARLP